MDSIGGGYHATPFEQVSISHHDMPGKPDACLPPAIDMPIAPSRAHRRTNGSDAGARLSLCARKTDQCRYLFANFDLIRKINAKTGRAEVVARSIDLEPPSLAVCSP